MDTSILKTQANMMNSNIKLAKEGNKEPTLSQLREQAVEKAAEPEKPKSIQEQYKEQQAAQQDKITLSEEGMQRLRGEKAKTEEEEKDENLPENIKMLKKQAKELKEDLEEKQKEIEELKRQPGTTIESLEPHMKQLQMMQLQLQSVKQSLADAIKEAGISDPSIMAGL